MNIPRLSLKARFLIGGICAALFLWILPAIDSWLKHHLQRRLEAAKVQTYVVVARCPRRPVMYERVVILDDGAGGSECIYVRTRGGYMIGKQP